MILKIVEQLKNESLTPNDLSKLRLELSMEYAFKGDQLMKILKDKPSLWLKIRNSGQVRSDTACERMWSQTEMGIKETELRWELKMIEKLSSAIRSRIEVLQGESRGVF